MQQIIEAFTGHANYVLVVALMMIGLYTALASHNFIKKLIGLTLMQSAVFAFYISIGKIAGGTAPILTQQDLPYSNPLPHVLILTAIVVGISTVALGLALCVRIAKTYGSVEEDDILKADAAQESGQ